MGKEKDEERERRGGLLEEGLGEKKIGEGVTVRLGKEEHFFLQRTKAGREDKKINCDVEGEHKETSSIFCHDTG